MKEPCAMGARDIAMLKVQLPLNTDSLAFCSGPQEGWLAVGSYELAACRNVRHGRLHILAVENSSEDGLQVAELCSRNLPGVFDLKWSGASADRALLGLALSDGTIDVLRPSWAERTLGPSQSLVIEENTLATCVDFDPRDARSLTASTARGQLSVVQVTESALAVDQKWQAHESEIWCCAFSPAQAHLIISGADDCALKTWDIRISPARPSSINRRDHKAGICCVRASPTQDSVVYTGSYDECIRSWDLRQLSSPSGQIELGGGVWRMTWHPADGNYLAAACMHNGCTVLKMPSPDTCGMQAVQRYDAHESIAYDVEWVCIGESKDIVASCSFYDNMLHFWNLKK